MLNDNTDNSILTNGELSKDTSVEGNDSVFADAATQNGNKEASQSKSVDEVNKYDPTNQTPTEDDKTVGARHTMCFKILILNDNVKPLHIYVFYLHSVMIITLFTFFNSIQSFVLTDFYGVDSANLGSVTGVLTLIDEVLSICALVLWGAFSDKFGRRLSLILGYCLVALAFIAIPHGKQVFPDYMIMRLIFAIGTSSLSTMLTAVLADYVYTETLGKASGILGVTSGLGAVIGIFVLVGQVPIYLCLSNTFYLVAGFCILMAIVIAFGLQSLKSYQTSADGAETRENMLRIIISGFKLGFTNRRIALAYVSGFLARGGGFIITVFVSLWVNKFFIENDICESQEEDMNGSISVCGEVFETGDRQSCDAAFTEASRITGIAQVAALVTAPFFGLLGDYFTPETALAITSLFSTLAYGLVGLDIDPTSPVSNGLAILWGMAEIGIIVVSQILVTKNMPPEIHGAVAGTYSLTGGIGIVFMSYLGGYLFDVWFDGAPFVIASILAFIIFAFSVYVRLTEPSILEMSSKPKQSAPNEKLTS